MTPDDFSYLRALLKERSGLVLSAEKQYLAESRLLPLARKNALSTLAELVGKLKQPQSAALCGSFSLPTSSASVVSPFLRASGRSLLSARYCFSAASTRPERSLSSARR